MDRNLTFILLLAVGVFFGMTYCQDQDKTKKPVTSQSAPGKKAPKHNPDKKVFPSGVAQAAPRSQPIIETDKMKVVFDTRGAAVRQLFLKDYTKRCGADKGLEENWVPLIDTRVYEYKGIPAEDLKPFYSFQLVDSQCGLNIYSRTDGKDVEANLSSVNWAVSEFKEKGEHGLRFSLPLSSGLELRKEFRFRPGDQHFTIALSILNHSYKGESTQCLFDFYGASVVPSQELMLGPKYSVRDFMGQNKAIVVTVDGTTGELQTETLSGDMNAPYWKKLVSAVGGTRVLFAGSSQKFFTCLMKPLDESDYLRVLDVTASKVPVTDIYHESVADNFSHVVTGMSLKLVRMPEIGQERSLTMSIYAGPKDVNLWNEVPEYNDYYSVYASDLESQGCFCPVPFVSSVGKILLTTLRFFQSIVGNWGFAIVLLTILVRAFLVPFNFKSQFEMAKYQKRMAKVKPMMDAIRKKFEKNRQKMNQELMALQKKHKITPPIMGCLPMFITLPVFIGLFTALRICFDLRHQPFMFWIKDLSMPDRLFQIHSNTEGFLGYTTHFNLLPILMTFLWWFQQKLMPKSDDPSQKQMQVMMQFMPVMMGIFLYNYAAGLSLYMCISSLFGIIEARIIRKRVKAMTVGEGES